LPNDEAHSPRSNGRHDAAAQQQHSAANTTAAHGDRQQATAGGGAAMVENPMLRGREAMEVDIERGTDSQVEAGRPHLLPLLTLPSDSPNQGRNKAADASVDLQVHIKPSPTTRGSHGGHSAATVVPAPPSPVAPAVASSTSAAPATLHTATSRSNGITGGGLEHATPVPRVRDLTAREVAASLEEIDEGIPRDIEHSITGIFLFGRPGLYFFSIEMILLMQCFYISMILTQMLPMVTNGGWIFGFIIPVLAIFYVIQLILNKVRRAFVWGHSTH